MDIEKSWKTIGLSAGAGAIIIPLLFFLFTKETSISFYLHAFVVSFFAILIGIGIIVTIHSFFTEKMEVDESEKDYSLDSTEESGKRQKGSDEE